MSPKAGSTGRGGDCRAGLDEGVDEAFAYGLPVDLLGGREDDASEALSDRPAFKDKGCGAEVLDAPIGARADDNLVDGRFSASSAGRTLDGRWGNAI